jgi:hypothetical protein
MEETTNGLPTGAIDREPLDYPEPGVYPDAAKKAEILMGVFGAAGVELGAYDDRIAVWLAQTADWSTFAVIASWVQRAAAGEERPAKGCTHPPADYFDDAYDGGSEGWFDSPQLDGLPDDRD